MLKSTRTLPWCCVVNLLLAEDSVDFCLESPPAPCQDGLLVALCSFHDALYFCIPLIKDDVILWPPCSISHVKAWGAMQSLEKVCTGCDLLDPCRAVRFLPALTGHCSASAGRHPRLCHPSAQIQMASRTTAEAEAWGPCEGRSLLLLTHLTPHWGSGPPV